MKKFWRIILTILGLVLLGACGNQQQTTAKSTTAKSSRTSKRIVKPYLQTTRPTFYVHGFQGSAKSTNTMI